MRELRWVELISDKRRSMPLDEGDTVSENLNGITVWKNGVPQGGVSSTSKEWYVYDDGKDLSAEVERLTRENNMLQMTVGEGSEILSEHVWAIAGLAGEPLKPCVPDTSR